MGFMDRAKKIAEQAQAKLDEAQAKFNESHKQRTGPGQEGPVVRYDSAGRPIGEAAPGSPPPPSPAEPAATGATPQAAPQEGEGEHAPPKMTSGDPLAG